MAKKILNSGNPNGGLTLIDDLYVPESGDPFGFNGEIFEPEKNELSESIEQLKDSAKKTTESNNKNAWLWGLLIIVVIAGLLMVYKIYNNEREK